MKLSKFDTTFFSETQCIIVEWNSLRLVIPTLLQLLPRFCISADILRESFSCSSIGWRCISRRTQDLLWNIRRPRDLRCVFDNIKMYSLYISSSLNSHCRLILNMQLFLRRRSHLINFMRCLQLHKMKHVIKYQLICRKLRCVSATHNIQVSAF